MQFIIAGTGSGQIAMFDVETLEKVKSWQSDGFVRHIAHSRTDGHIVASFKNNAKVWNSR